VVEMIQEDPIVMGQSDWLDDAWDQVIHKIGKTSKRIGVSFPHASKEGTYDAMPVAWWTGGFWPGLLWLLYRETGDASLRKIAEDTEELMDETLREFDKFDHDAGFLWSLTSVAHYKLVGNEPSKRRALVAASHLAGRFNLRGRFIRAWNDKPTSIRTGWSIIDTMMNLPLLFWASETLNDPRFSHIAMAHADTVLEHFVDPDGAVRHIVQFDPETGDVVEVKGGQGYSPTSAWSRGAAWALHGMILTYKYTKEQRYLLAAKRIAQFFIANLPEDHVPHWDFRAPEASPRGLDTSAAACAASSFLEIAQAVDPAESQLFRDAASRIVKSLFENYGTWFDDREEGLIRMGTVNFNSGRYVNLPLIYGDYFFVEALAKLRGQDQIFW
jgi:unsaturated chondroitin disaccharide hydrolase